MARLTAIDPGTATGKAKVLLEQVHAALGVAPNMMRTMAQSPVVLGGYLGLNQTLAGGALSAKLREQIALAVAESNRCVYCLSAHTTIGRQVGLTPEEVAGARAASSSEPRDAAALRFARSLVERSGDVTDADVHEVRKAGYTEGEVVEIVAHVALNIFTNYFNKAADVEVDFPRVALATEALTLTGMR